MAPFDVDEFLRTHAPTDVQDTVGWLATQGYALASHEGESTFGATFVYAGDAEVRITVDKSQWYLDVAPRPGAQAWAYDLLIAAREGEEYGAVFPRTGSRSWRDPLPDQLPEGVRWRETLPGILQWLSDEVGPAVERALRQRHALMWPRNSR